MLRVERTGVELLARFSVAQAAPQVCVSTFARAARLWLEREAFGGPRRRLRILELAHRFHTLNRETDQLQFLLRLPPHAVFHGGIDVGELFLNAVEEHQM